MTNDIKGKIISSCLILFLLILSVFFIYFNKINNFENNLINVISEENEIGKVYEIKEFMNNFHKLMGVNFIDIKDGFDIESADGFEKFVLRNDDRVIEVIKTRLYGVGDLEKPQVFLEEVTGAYQCTPNSKIIVTNIQKDSSVYFIRLLDCIRIK